MPAPVNDPKPAAAPERRGIQSVEIAFRVLTALQHAAKPLPLREIALRADLSASAANNYLVSLVRTGLARADERPGCYRLGPAALSLGMSALQQIDGFELVRREVTAVRDATARNAALSGWSEAGPVSLFKQDGEHREAFEMRTGVIPVTTTAAGRMYMACLPAARTLPLIRRELTAAGEDPKGAEELRQDAVSELERNRYTAVTRAHASGYVSIAAPVWDMHGEARFGISLMGARGALDTGRNGAHVRALLDAVRRASAALGGASPVRVARSERVPSD